MSDYMIRGTAADDAVRAFACTTKDMVEQMREYHDTWPVVSAALGRLITAASMMGVMMKGDRDTLTVQIKSDGPVKGLIAVAKSNGDVKGMAFNNHVEETLKRPGKLDVGAAVGKGRLTVVKDLGLREPYVGTVSLVSGEIAEDITYYFAESEQVPSVVALGVLVDTDCSIKEAGGFMIQLMPGCPDEVITEIENRVKNIKSVTGMLEDGLTPEDMLESVLGSLDLHIMERYEPKYKCDCSREKMEKALLSLGLKDLQGLYDDNEPAEMCCEFCNKKYTFSHEEIGRFVSQRS